MSNNTVESHSRKRRASGSTALLKKLFLVVGSLLGLLVLAAVLVPLFVDVDKYRPKIVDAAGEHINGKLELGKLALSLWGKVKVDIDGLKLTDSQGRTVIAVKDANFNMSLLSLLSGHPTLRLQLVGPTINLVKQRNGKLNAMTLLKETPATTGGVTPVPLGTAPKSAPAAGKTEVPSIVMNARYTVLLDHAKVTYKDELTGDAYNINDLNFRLEDVSPSSHMPFELSANLDMFMQNKIKVMGPLVFKGDILATSSHGEFDKAEATASLKLDGLEITYPGTFEKRKGVALGADVKATVGKDSFTVPTMVFRLGEVTINGETTGKTVGEVTTIDFKAQSNRIDVTKLSEFSPLIKEYGMNGLLELGVNAHGPTSHLAYGANLKFNKISLTNEALKQPIEVNGALTVATNEIQNLSVKLAAQNFDLDLKGSMQNFLAPRFKFSLNSSNMDLDGLLKSSEKAAVARKEHNERQMQSPASAPSKAEAPVVDYNAMFKPLRENPVTAAAAGTFDFNLKRIKTTGVVINGMQGELALNALNLALKNFSMHIFDGAIKGGMSFNVRSAKPEVGTNITMSGLDTQKMVENQMPIARNTVKGVISGALNIGGAGLNQSDIIAGWKGNGNFDIKDAVISTLDVGRQIKDGLLEKIPNEAIRSKIKVPDSVLAQKGQYDVMSTKFALASGVLNINDITGKAHPQKGLDLKGAGTVKLADYGLDLALDVIDTYNLIPWVNENAKDPKYGHFAAQLKVGCTIYSPCYDWGSTIAKLAQNALRSQATDQIKKFIPGVGGGDKKPNVQDAAKALKGLFGR